MMNARLDWDRPRWTLTFAALAVGIGLAVGVLTDFLLALPTPHGSRATFTIELLFAAVGAMVLSMLLASRARVGLSVLLAILAFLPSRTGMQWQYSGYMVVSVTDLAIALGFFVLILQKKILARETLQRVVLRKPLWAWLAIGFLGVLVAIARGIPWVNYVPEVKAYYLWVLTIILCVNVIRSWSALTAILVIAVVSSVPPTAAALIDSIRGQGGFAVMLGNGEVVLRTSGGSGVANPFALYLMTMFFLTIGLASAVRRRAWRWLIYGYGALLLVAIGMTYSRGAWIATAVGLLVLGLAGGRRVLLGIVVACSLGYFVVPPQIFARLTFADHSVAQRLSYNQVAWATIQEFPVLGAGWGSSFYLEGPRLVPDDKPGHVTWWHDDYLNVATEVGLPGLAVFLWLWASLIRSALGALRRASQGLPRTYLLVLLAALAAVLTQAFTDMFFWRTEAGPLIWLIGGLTCAAINLVNQQAAPLTGTLVTARGNAPSRGN